eukprot:983011-Pelagomonas_calceolata.AAC.4
MEHTLKHTHIHTYTHTQACACPTCVAAPDIEHDLGDAAAQGHDEHTGELQEAQDVDGASARVEEVAAQQGKHASCCGGQRERGVGVPACKRVLMSRRIRWN